nr:hypothetical protein [Candidatus Sigynarchaeum springense]
MAIAFRDENINKEKREKIHGSEHHAARLAITPREKPRSDQPRALYVDEHGTLYWFADASGNFNEAFVFTQDTYAADMPYAIGVMVDYDLDHRWTIPYGNINEPCPDSFFPTIWNCPDADEWKDMSTYAGDVAWDTYCRTVLGDDMHWWSFLINLGVNVGIMVAASAAESNAIAFVVTFVLFYVWSQVQAPLMSTIEDACDPSRYYQKRQPVDITAGGVVGKTGFNEDVEAQGAVPPHVVDPWQEPDPISMKVRMSDYHDYHQWYYDYHLDHIFDKDIGLNLCLKRGSIFSGVFLQNIVTAYSNHYLRAYPVHDSNRGSGQTSGNLVPVLSLGLHGLGMGDFLIPLVLIKKWAETGQSLTNLTAIENIVWGLSPGNSLALSYTFPLTEYPGVVDLPDLVATTAGSDPATGAAWFDVTYNVSRAFYDDWLEVLQLPAGSALQLELFVQREGWSVDAWDVDLAHNFATARFDVAMNGTEQHKVVTVRLPATRARSSRASWVGYETDYNRTYGGVPTVTMTYADVSYIAEQERWLMQYTDGRIGRIMPYSRPLGDLGYIFYPATSTMPNFYRSTEGEANALRNADGTIAVHDWQLGQQEMAYQADLAITSLVTEFATLYPAKMKQGLFGIFQGADWRIWLVGVVETAVQSAAAAVVAKAITGVKEVHAIVEGGKVVQVEVTKRFGQVWNVAKQTFDFTWKQLAIDLLKDIFGAMWDEVIKEQLVSETLRMFGLPDAFCEEMGEYFFFGGEQYQNRQEAKAARQEFMSELAKCQARAALNVAGEVNARIDAAEGKAQLDTTAETATAKAEIASIKSVAKEKAVILAALEGAMTLRAFARSVDKGCTAAFLSEADADAALAGVDVTLQDFEIQNLVAVASRNQYARACVHALVQAMRTAVEYNKVAAEGAKISPKELMDSPALRALFQCPAGNYMGINVKHGDVTTTWVQICERHAAIDGEFLSFLQGADEIEFFDPKKTKANDGIVETKKERRARLSQIAERAADWRNKANKAMARAMIVAETLEAEAKAAGKSFSVTFRDRTCNTIDAVEKALSAFLKSEIDIQPNNLGHFVGVVDEAARDWAAGVQDKSRVAALWPAGAAPVEAAAPLVTGIQAAAQQHPGWVKVAAVDAALPTQQRAPAIIPVQILASALQGHVQQFTTITPQDLIDPAFKQDVIESIMDSKATTKQAAIEYIKTLKAKNRFELVAALFEAKVKQFVRRIASTANQLQAMPAGAGQYETLLEHVFGTQGRSAIKAASQAGGGNVQFTVEKTQYKKGIDVKLVARTASGAYITGAGFECKTEEDLDWITGGNLATQLVNQATLAAIDGEPVSKMFVVAADVGATDVPVTWLDGTKTPSAPLGSKTVAAFLHPGARSSHLSSDGKSVVTRDASGRLVAAQRLVFSPDPGNPLRAAMLMPGDGQGGLQPLVQKAGITVAFDARAYGGAAYKPLTNPSNPGIHAYATANGLPGTLTVAQYNLAKALDASGVDYKTYHRDGNGNPIWNVPGTTPSKHLELMLDCAMKELFETQPKTVTFSLGFLVGGPHADLVALARLFRI